VHELLARELGVPCVVGIPHRDTLLAAPLGHAALVATLRERVRDDARRAPHAISSTLLVLDPRGSVEDFEPRHDDSPERISR
jgi:hypothetical protein